MNEHPRVSLSLSGGGYRAAGFHLGTLKKLHEMDVLKKIDVISTISGGSILRTYYCLSEEPVDQFFERTYGKLQADNVIQRTILSSTFLGLFVYALAFLVPTF